MEANPSAEELWAGRRRGGRRVGAPASEVEEEMVCAVDVVEDKDEDLALDAADVAKMGGDGSGDGSDDDGSDDDGSDEVS